MTYNSDGLEYPENIYADVAKFCEENRERCYYYHKVSTDMPQNAAETMDYLLENFFSRREKLTELVELMYKGNLTFDKSTMEAGIGSEEAGEILKQFYRDLLYFPRYNEIFSKGVN